MSSETPQELNTPKSWEVARAYADKIGEMPFAFTSSIRMLLVDEKETGEMTNANATQAALLLNSPSLKAMFYFAAKTLAPDKVEETKYISKRKLAAFFSPYELASLLAMAFLFRRCRKRSKNDLFENLVFNIQRDVNIGAFVGQAIPHIGVGWGIMIGGIRHLAETAFLLHDSDGYGKYSRHRAKLNVSFDIDFEVSRWGCTSMQVASVLLQSLGFGVELAESLVIGLDPRTPEEEIKEDRFYRVKITRLWIDTLIETGEIPQITHRGNYYPLESNLTVLFEKLQTEPTRGTDQAWLTKSKSDITPDKVPSLYLDANRAMEKMTESEEEEDEDFE